MAEADYAALPGLDPMLPTTVGALKQRLQLLPTPVLAPAAASDVRALALTRSRGASSPCAALKSAESLKPRVRGRGGGCTTHPSAICSSTGGRTAIHHLSLIHI